RSWDRGAPEQYVRGEWPRIDLTYSAGAGATRRRRSPLTAKTRHATLRTVAISHHDSVWVAGTRPKYVVASGTRRLQTIARSGRVTNQPRSIMIPCVNVKPISKAQAAS